MNTNIVLPVFILLSVLLNVEAKAVGKKINKDFNYSPAVYTDFHQTLNSDYETNGAIKGQKSTPKREYINYIGNPKATQHYVTDYSNRPYDEKYDLTNHDNLEQMISGIPSHMLNSNEIHQDPGKHGTKKLTSKANYESLTDDQVFLHKIMKPKHAKHVIENSDISKSKVEIKSLTTNAGNAGEAGKDSLVLEATPKRVLQFYTNTSNVKNKTRQLPSSVNEKHLSRDFSTSIIGDSNSNKNLDQRNIEPESESETLFSSGESEIRQFKETISDINPETKQSLKLLNNKHSVANVLDTEIKSEEDKHLFRMEVNQMFDSNIKSFVFNPSAQPLDKFQECTTPRNESGFCRYLQHCFLPGILSTIQHFVENVCIIEGRFIGVCCPQFPVSTVFVSWGSELDSLDSSSNNSVEVPEDCGVGTNTRIVGGTNANRKAWPWMVALLNNKDKFFCGGSLINNRYVLTAAHCTFGSAKSQIVARLGEYDFNDPRDPHDDYRVIEVKRHGQYNRLTLRNDIALLKLEKPVIFNEFIQTICFPEVEKDYIGDMATLAGWGHLDGGSGSTSDVLQEANFPIISNTQCSRTHGVSVPSSLICAAAPTHDKGACNGDSGGPLMLLDENERWKVIGVVSWGRRGCNPKFPTVYSRITHYMEWIRKHSI